MQRIGERLHHPVEPLDHLERLRHLAGQPRRAPLAHPRVAGRSQTGIVVVSAVPERSPCRQPLRHRASTVGTGSGQHTLGEGILTAVVLAAVVVDRFARGVEDIVDEQVIRTNRIVHVGVNDDRPRLRGLHNP